MKLLSVIIMINIFIQMSRIYNNISQKAEITLGEWIEVLCMTGSLSRSSEVQIVSDSWYTGSLNMEVKNFSAGCAGWTISLKWMGRCLGLWWPSKDSVKLENVDLWSSLFTLSESTGSGLRGTNVSSETQAFPAVITSPAAPQQGP